MIQPGQRVITTVPQSDAHDGFIPAGIGGIVIGYNPNAIWPYTVMTDDLAIIIVTEGEIALETEEY